jgi:hypothetical protein
VTDVEAKAGARKATDAKADEVPIRPAHYVIHWQSAFKTVDGGPAAY